MTRPELTGLLVSQCDESGLPLQEKMAALRVALTRVQMNVSPGLAGPGQKARKAAKIEPLNRPSGKFMGKQKRSES